MNVTPTNKFGWLVKREFWEYRGGFFWAPLITSMVMLALMLMTVLIAETTAHRNGIRLSGMNFGDIAEHLSSGQIDRIHAGIDVGLLSLGFPIAIALFFVVFFYGIGSLYNDRADRSVLFWKSLPISDTQTVLAKVAAMTLLAPALSVVAMIALHLGFLLLMSIYVGFHGVNPLPIWSPTHLVALWLKLILLIPVNALWAMPSIGWLLLCSSYARSKPFMWAVGLPIIVGVLVTWFGLMNSLSVSSGWFWHNIVGRALLSIVPGSWVNVANLHSLDNVDGPDMPAAVIKLLSVGSIGDALTSPDLLVGVVAGVAMIAAAIYFRRQRTESYA